MVSVPQVETLIKEKRELDSSVPVFRFSWEDSADFTQFLLRWNTRPKVFTISQIFADELRRRRGLRAYGMKVVKRKSKVNQIHSGNIVALKPRELVPEPEVNLEVANAEAA